MPDSFKLDCRDCPRLAGFLDQVRRDHPGYHARPVPPFGDAAADLLIVGLAPGMHGANRTGRPFTGDYAGILLYAALHQFGFASRAGIGSRRRPLGAQKLPHQQRGEMPAAAEQAAAGGDPLLQPLSRRGAAPAAAARDPGAGQRRAPGRAPGLRAQARQLQIRPSRRAHAAADAGLAGRHPPLRQLSLQPLQYADAGDSPKPCSTRYSATSLPSWGRGEHARRFRAGVRCAGADRQPAAPARRLPHAQRRATCSTSARRTT